jgi:tetratricopeptide (TPR) repeat protein
MRLAIVATSSYTECGTLAELLEAESQAELLGRRLAERDAGFTVHVLPAVRGMAEELESVLASVSEPVESAIFFFSGYVVVSDEDVPALLLDGERLSTLSLRRVRRLFTPITERSLFVLDTVTAFPGPRTPHEVAALLNEGFALDRVDMHVLVANRHAPLPGEGPSPFTSLLALTLDWQATDQGLSPKELFFAMQSEASLYDRIEAAEFEEGSMPFHVLLPRSSQAFSIRPRVSSVPVRGGAEARADAYVENGDFQSAFVEYTAALEELGPADEALHPPIYAKIARALKLSGRDDDALRYYEAALDLDPELPSALEGAADLRIDAGDLREALALLRRWLHVEPNAERAAERAARILVDSGEWAELASLYGTVLDRASDPGAAVQLALKIDALYTDVLDEPSRGFPALVRAVQLAPNDPRVHARLATAFERRGEALRALDHALAAVNGDPERAEYHRNALRLFERCGEADGAWHAACALEVLGKADVNESLLASAHRPTGLIAARDGLNDSHWERGLLCPDRDVQIDELFRLLGGALEAVGLEGAAQKRRVANVDPSTEVDPKTSTVTLVKTLGWAARLLGVPLPKVHVLGGLRAPFIAPPSREPLLLVDRALGSGIEVRELAFLIGRALVCFRPEHRPMTLFPTLDELSAVLSASLSLGNVAQLPFKSLEGDAKVFARGLRRHLKVPQLNALESFAQTFPVREANAKILSWVRAVELSSARAGLVACGDLELAASLIRRHPLGTAVNLDDQVRTLLGYAVSPAYAALRKHVGVLLPR